MTSAAGTTDSLLTAARWRRPRRLACAIWCGWRRRGSECRSMRDAPFSLRLYRRLLRLYPASFRENYAELLEREFQDEFEDAAGAFARLLLCARLLKDLALSIPVQLGREIAQDGRHTVRL